MESFGELYGRLRWELPEWIGWQLRRAWSIIHWSPLAKCPVCHGQGGAVEGYFEPEFVECDTCWPFWRDAEDHHLDWAVGRLDPLRWLRAWLLAKTAGHRTLRTWAFCGLGFHAPTKYGFCGNCYREVRDGRRA